MPSFIRILISILILAQLSACTSSSEPSTYSAEDALLLHRLNNKLTNTILQDGFSPPVAARAYAYCNIAAYESVRYLDPELKSLAGQLNGLESLPQIEDLDKVDLRLVMLAAYKAIASDMMYRDYVVEEFATKMMHELDEGISEQVYKASEKAADELVAALREWISKDYYKETRGMHMFVVNKGEGKWQPTPPNYNEAIEPHWMKIRPLVLDSATQFKPLPPEEFSKEEGSGFYNLAMEVYDVVNAMKEGDENLQVAKFWDCNPMVSINKGHLMYAKRQLTPGGHWMGIARLACKKKGLDLPATAEVYARTGISLSDAFISCWDEKYRSDLIRPETYINEYIDPTWRPILETPMFPEHTSGHSVVSGSASTTLTDLFGDGFAYVDSVNVPYGLPPRYYESFNAAASEAAESRLYGGIHYRPAIDYGVSQGRELGRFINDRIQTRNSAQ